MVDFLRTLSEQERAELREYLNTDKSYAAISSFAESDLATQMCPDKYLNKVLDEISIAAQRSIMFGTNRHLLTSLKGILLGQVFKSFAVAGMLKEKQTLENMLNSHSSR